MYFQCCIKHMSKVFVDQADNYIFQIEFELVLFNIFSNLDYMLTGVVTNIWFWKWFGQIGGVDLLIV